MAAPTDTSRATDVGERLMSVNGDDAFVAELDLLRQGRRVRLGFERLALDNGQAARLYETGGANGGGEP
jgi:hypothetical protein